MVLKGVVANYRVDSEKSRYNYLRFQNKPDKHLFPPTLQLGKNMHNIDQFKLILPGKSQKTMQSLRYPKTIVISCRQSARLLKKP